MIISAKFRTQIIAVYLYHHHTFEMNRDKLTLPLLYIPVYTTISLILQETGIKAMISVISQRLLTPHWAGFTRMNDDILKHSVFQSQPQLCDIFI